MTDYEAVNTYEFYKDFLKGYGFNLSCDDYGFLITKPSDIVWCLELETLQEVSVFTTGILQKI